VRGIKPLNRAYINAGSNSVIKISSYLRSISQEKRDIKQNGFNIARVEDCARAGTIK
jgi:hypothetical protein